MRLLPCADAARGGGDRLTWTLILFLHLLSAAIWIGGQITLFVAVPVLRRQLGPEQSAAPIRTVARRYGMVAGPALALLLVTGLLQADHLGVTPGDSDSEFARIVSEKFTLTMIIIALTVLHALLGARIGRAPSAPAAAHLRRWSMRLSVINLLLGIAVLWLAAELVT